MEPRRMHRAAPSRILSDDELRAVWGRSEFRRVPFTSAATARLLDACQSVFGRSNVRLAAFEVTGLAAATPELLDSDQYGRHSFAEALLSSRGFARALPEVVGVQALRPPRFVHLSPLVLDGRLAQILQDGGPRERFAGDGAEAKAIGVGFCTDVFEERYDEVRIEHSTAQWSGWFRGVAWDHTFVVVDMRWRVLTVLCLTDGDVVAPRTTPAVPTP